MVRQSDPNEAFQTNTTIMVNNFSLFRTLFCFTLSFLTFMTCAQKIFSDYDGKADWQNYKTHAWVPLVYAM